MSISISKLARKLFGNSKPLEGKALEVLRGAARKFLFKDSTSLPKFYPRRDNKSSIADGYILLHRWRSVKYENHPTEKGKSIWPDPVKDSNWNEWSSWMKPFNAKFYEDLETAQHAVSQKKRSSEYWQEEYIIVPIAFIAQDASGLKDTLELTITEWMSGPDDKSAAGLARWIMKDIFDKQE